MTELITIKRWDNGELIFNEYVKPSYECSIFKDGVILAIKNNVNLQFADFKTKSLSGLNLNNVNFENADFRYAKLNGFYGTFGGYYPTSFENANLKNANFENADCTDAFFDGADIDGAIFNGANLKGTILEGKVDTKKIFREVYDAVEINDIESCKTLLEKGKDINLVNIYNQTPLYIAVTNKYLKVENTNNYLEVAKFLLENKAIVNINSTYMPINYAVAVRDYDMVKLLLEYKANPNSIYRCQPILHDAIRNISKNTVKILLEYGADPNLKGLNGDTSLHVAIKVKNIDIFTMLLSYGADLNIKNNDGFNALELNGY